MFPLTDPDINEKNTKLLALKVYMLTTTGVNVGECFSKLDS